MHSKQQKTLAIVGASYLQLPLVERANAMGLRAICFAWPQGAVCKDICDQFYPISIVNKEEILAVCRSEHINGITSIASDVAVPTISYVAAALGLPGNSEECAYKATNKGAMRETFSAAGLPCPKFVRVKSTLELPSKAFNYPVIVKPSDRSGSLGVLKVETPVDLSPAVEKAIEVSLSKEAIVEEFIANAREVSVEGISWDGDYHFLTITDKVTTDSPHFVELEQHQPAILPPGIWDEMRSIVEAAVKALGVTYGATHAELMLTPDNRIYITEIGARMGGDFIGSDLVLLSTGYDFVKGVIQCALGDFVPPVTATVASSGVFFASSETKDVRAYIANKHKSDAVIRMARTGEPLDVPLASSGERDGYIIYQAQHRINNIKEL